MKLGAVQSGRRRRRWEQPRQRRAVLALPDRTGPASKTDRCTSAGTSGGTPSSGTPARTWWIWAGQQCVLVTSGGGQLRVGPGLAGSEATVKVCGVVVARLQGKSWAPIPSSGRVVNVGTIVESPSLPVGLAGSGKAHRQLTARRWDGALVVVRGRESRPHGEGGQQVRSRCAGMSGDRR